MTASFSVNIVTAEYTQSEVITKDSGIKAKKNNDMRTPIYFTLEEMLDSSIARQKGISNLPSWEIVENLNELGLFLDDIRTAWGGGITVTSGFRCPALNKAAGGVSDSLHLKGFAADIRPSNGDMAKFKVFIVNYLKDKDFDECILEKSKKSEWVHIQLYSNKGFQRKKVFSLTK